MQLKTLRVKEINKSQENQVSIVKVKKKINQTHKIDKI